MAEIIQEVHLVKYDVDENNKKFWIGKLYDDDTLFTHWGLVGTKGQNKTYSSGGASTFNKKKREKERKGYKEVEVVSSTSSSTGKAVQGNILEKVAEEQIKTSSQECKDLVKYLIRQNVHNIVSKSSIKFDESDGLFKTPLGIIGKDSIVKARAILEDISNIIANGESTTSKKAKQMAADYLMLVPQDIGRKFTFDIVFPNMDKVKENNDILDSLEASLNTFLTVPPKKDDKGKDEPAIPKLFDASIEKVESAAEISRIVKAYEKTLSSSHVCSHLKVKRVFKVTIEHMENAFKENGVHVGNVKNLWHGTRVSNVLSILKSGMIIPPSNAPHCTGRMFGHGIYFSDQSTKALNYAYGYWGGKGYDDNCFMFFANVAMGKEWTPPGPKYDAHVYCAKNGYDSCFAKGKVSGVGNNEMIVYKTHQCNLVYLVEFAAGSTRRRW